MIKPRAKLEDFKPDKDENGFTPGRIRASKMKQYQDEPNLKDRINPDDIHLDPIDIRIDNNRHQKLNLIKMLEFGWEKNRSLEIIHFLSNPPPPLEWTDIYPSERQFAKL